MALCSFSVAAAVVGAVVVVKALGRLAFRGAGHGCGGGPAFAACGGGRHGGPWSRWRRFRSGGIGQSFWLRRLFHRLDTTPGQEREIRAALEDLADRVRDAGRGLRSTRESVARALAGDVFDDAAFEATSARADAATAQVKDAVRGALVRIHGTLDAKQRGRLADLVVAGGLFGRSRRQGPWNAGGPYRVGSDPADDTRDRSI